MKIFISILFIAIAAIRLNEATLADDFQEFEDLIPKRKLIPILLKYSIFDRQFKELKKYMKGKEFGQAWDQVIQHDEVGKFVRQLDDEGVDIISKINQIAGFLGQSRFPKEIDLFIRGGIVGLIDDIMAVMPVEKFKNKFEEKMDNSVEFRELYDQISDFDIVAIEKFIKDSKEITAFLTKLRGYKVDIDFYVRVLKEIFGWK